METQQEWEGKRHYREGRPKLVSIEQALVDSSAFNSLPGLACKVLIYFLRKRRMVKPGKRADWVIANNGEIVFTYNEAVEHRISRQAFSRALDHLIDRGFIDIAGQGIGIRNAPTWYAISERWRKWGTPDFVKGKRQKRHSHKFPTGGDHPRAKSTP